MSKLRDQLKFEEGFKLKAYYCTKNKLTIGVGRNLTANPYYQGKKIPHKITAEFAEELLDYDIGATIGALRQRWPRIDEFDKARRDAFINMAFQLGVDGFMGFERMRAAALSRNWPLAHKEALDSDWNTPAQTPERAHRVAGQILTGKYYEIPK